MMRAFLAAAFLLLTATVAGADNLPRYKVLSEDAGEIHRTVELRLERRMAETDLKHIAKVVKERAPREFRRTLVNFYLPGMKPGEGAWAQVTYTKELSLRINGLRLDEEQAYTAEARADGRNIIGTWLTSTPAVPGRLTIVRERGKLIAEWRLRNGALTSDEVAETRGSHGRRFDTVPQSADHYVLTGNGDLELRQGERLVAVAERIRLATEPETAANNSSVRKEPQTVSPAPAADVRAASAVVLRAQRGRAAAVEAIVADSEEPLKLSPRAVDAAPVDIAPIEGAKAVAANNSKPIREASAESAMAANAQQASAAEIPREKRKAVAIGTARHRNSGGGAAANSSSGGNGAQERLVGRIFRGAYQTY